jgi:hypothetical protein
MLIVNVHTDKWLRLWLTKGIPVLSSRQNKFQTQTLEKEAISGPQSGLDTKTDWLSAVEWLWLFEAIYSLDNISECKVYNGNLPNDISTELFEK